jgi:hypothetical protein
MENRNSMNSKFTKVLENVYTQLNEEEWYGWKSQPISNKLIKEIIKILEIYHNEDEITLNNSHFSKGSTPEEKFSTFIDGLKNIKSEDKLSLYLHKMTISCPELDDLYKRIVFNKFS